jgi:hypothetical protein
MAGLRAEQSSKVYAQQGYPEEAAKSTLAAQGIAKNQTEQQKSAFELKALKRTEALHSTWEAEDLAHKEYLNPETPIAEKDKYAKTLISKVLPMIDGNNPYLPGVVAKGMSKDGKEITIEQEGKTRTVPVSDALIQKAHMLVHLARDPKTQAEYHMKMAESTNKEAGLDRRNDADNKTNIGIAQGNNTAMVKAAGIRASSGGSGGVPGMTPEMNQERVTEMNDVIAQKLPPHEEAIALNRIQMKYNYKAAQQKVPKPEQLSVGDLTKIHEMVGLMAPRGTPDSVLVQKANNIYPGAGDQLYGDGKPKPTVGLPAAEPGSLPPQAIASLKEGQVTHFKNGQSWTLQNGNPVRTK